MTDNGVTRNGFTLVEMLVAVAIFGLIASASVSILSMSMTAQEAAGRKLADASSVRRASALLAGDLANAAPRLRRDEQGAVRPAFDADGAGFRIVRRSASLQRVEYRLDGNRLERRSAGAVDGAAPDRTAVLLRGVEHMSLRFRSLDGLWRERWDPEDPRLMPQAVELVVKIEGRGAVRQLFLVGTGE
ncbi:MAG TPA: type II secretion system minor pseudopilin GspJ [Allosphingosinicella sp.]|nr:type II secretion system minor pseudopilin GspJ [Allosphingosinicella sp.]